jgi:hypothetical protein
MTEVPEYLRRRSEEARKKAAAKKRGEEPPDALSRLPEHLRRRVEGRRHALGIAGVTGSDDVRSRIPQHLLDRADAARRRAISLPAEQSTEAQNPQPKTYEQYRKLLGGEITKLQERFPDQPLTRLALESFEKSVGAVAALTPGFKFVTPEPESGLQQSYEVVWDYHGDIPEIPRNKIIDFYRNKTDVSDVRKPLQEGSLAMARYWNVLAGQDIVSSMPDRSQGVLMAMTMKSSGVLRTMRTAFDPGSFGLMVKEGASRLPIHPEISDAIDAVTELLSVDDKENPAWHLNHYEDMNWFGREQAMEMLRPDYYEAGARLMAAAIPLKEQTL